MKRTALAQALRAPTPTNATTTVRSSSGRGVERALFHSSVNRRASATAAAAVSETSLVFDGGAPATAAASKNALLRFCVHQPGTAKTAASDAPKAPKAPWPSEEVSKGASIFFFRSVANARSARRAAFSTTIAAIVSGRKKRRAAAAASASASSVLPGSDVSASARAASALGNGTLAVPRASSSAEAETFAPNVSRRAERGTPTSDRGSLNTHRGHVARRLSASAPRTRAACLSVNPTREGLERPPRSSGTTETSRAEPPEREAATVVDSAPRSMPIENASADARHASVAAANTSDAERARVSPPRARARRIAERRARARTEATPRCACVVTTAASLSERTRTRYAFSRNNFLKFSTEEGGHNRRRVGRRPGAAKKRLRGIVIQACRIATMGAKRCSHDKNKAKCIACNPCPYGKLKKNCKDCNPCPHGKVKGSCAECNPCPHGKVKADCVDCNFCPHGKLKSNCAECNPCPHGKHKRKCADCNPGKHGKR